MRTAVDQLRAGLDAVDLSSPLDQIYETCRTFDLRLLWLRRVREFFTAKFDQRDGDLADVISAADEVVWSCYHQVFARARELARIRTGAPPLPFIEPRYSPAMFPADLVPAGLQSDIDKPFLVGHLNRLPVSVVRLQPACVTGPWWLVYAAHEVGHSVQFDLAGRRALVDGYQVLVEQAVREAGGQAGDVLRWGRWSREVFADVFSVLMMGQWAIWAMVELELQGEAAMGERRELYPPGAVRLELLAATAAAVGLDSGAALRGVEPKRIAAKSPGASRDVGFVDAVAEASLKRLPSVNVTLSALCNFRAGDFQSGPDGKPSRVDGLRTALVNGGPSSVEQSLDGPRLGAAAALAAWSDVMGTVDETERAGLAARSLRLIRTSGPPGTRDSALAADASVAATDLAQALLTADLGKLEVQ